MPKIREIVGLINSALKANNFNGRPFQTGVWYELAYQVDRQEKDGDSFIDIKRPAIIDNSGEGTDVTYDDTYPITFYHRITSPLQYPVDNENFGNPNSSNMEVAEMAMICIADRSKVNVFTEDICAAMIQDIPKEFNQAQCAALSLNQIELEVIETNSDSVKVFNDEFQGVEFNLNPQMSMISVKYKLTTHYGSACFKICN